MIRKNILGILAFTTAALVGGCDDDDDNVVVDLDGRIVVIDTDNDLAVSVNEWNAAFVVFDVNGDGQIVAGEFRFNSVGFASADVNRDGFVTVTEWNATLAVWDVNGDRVLERVEFDPFL